MATEIDEAWDEIERRRGAGWILLAAALLIVSGCFKIWDAVWAFRYDDDLAEPLQTVLFEHDLAAWGWMWLLLGIGLIASGVAVVGGSQWGRWFGIGAAVVAMLGNYSWIFDHPNSTLLTQLLLLAVIYGLLVYGGRPTYENIQQSS